MKTEVRSYKAACFDTGAEIIHEWDIFATDQLFFEHLKKHFISELEPWARVISERLDREHKKGKTLALSSRIIGEDAAKAFFKKLSLELAPHEAVNLLDSELLQELYDAILLVLDDGIRYALHKPETKPGQTTRDRRPGYIIIEEDRIHATSRKREITYRLLSFTGFLVVINGHAVRTAFFPGKPGDKHEYTLFRNGWCHLRELAEKPLRRDECNGMTIRVIGQPRYISADYWRDPCPNPHRPKWPEKKYGMELSKLSCKINKHARANNKMKS